MSSKINLASELKRAHSSVILPSSKQMTFKIILIGQSFSGKTSLMNQYVHNRFSDKYDVTVGVDFASKFVKVFDEDDRQIFVQLQLWDTCGQDVFKSLTSSFFRGSCAVFLMYSVNDYKSFERLGQWIDKFHEEGSQDALIFLIGNKSDLERNVTKQEEFNFLKQIKGVFSIQTSAKTRQNVEELFTKAAQILLKKYYTCTNFRDLVRPKNDNTVSFAENAYDKESFNQNKQSFLLTENLIRQNKPMKTKKCCF